MIIPGLVAVVNNHGDRCCPLSGVGVIPLPHGLDGLYMGVTNYLLKWDDPPSMNWTVVISMIGSRRTPYRYSDTRYINCLGPNWFMNSR